MALIESRPQVLNFYDSPIGKKIITGFTGLIFTIFVIFHVLGNLLLLTNPKAYNQLAHFLDNLGILLYLVEIILGGTVVFHAIMGILLTINNRKSRSVDYQTIKSVGKPSKQSFSSRTMIITGLILLIFLVSHLLTFKFAQCDLIAIDGIQMRNLSKLVIETFQNPIYTITYSATMIFLGLHLRHGMWSGMQSLGIINQRWSHKVYWITYALSLSIVLGFIAIPITIYFS